MKFIIFLPILAILFTSCFENNNKRPTTALETGRAFIRTTLDGNFTDAEKLLLTDEENKALFESFKISYSKSPQEIKNGYKNSSYNINTFTDVNDSTSIINYSNSYMNKPMDIKIVKQNNSWVIDFKYTTTDTTTVP